MAYREFFTFFLLLNLCVILCASLPLTSSQRKGNDNLFLKLFSGEETSIQDSFDRYPWSRNEHAGRFPSEDRSYDENRKSKFQREQLEQNLRDREIKKSLLRDILNWETRRHEQVKQSEDPSVKREPQGCRVTSGHFGGKVCGRELATRREDEATNKDMEPFNRETGNSLKDDQGKVNIKQYDAELERTLRELEIEMRGRKQM